MGYSGLYDGCPLHGCATIDEDAYHKPHERLCLCDEIMDKLGSTAPKFKLEDRVWRIQGEASMAYPYGPEVCGPRIITAVIRRRDTGISYFTRHGNGDEKPLERDEEDLFSSRDEAEAEADRQHARWIATLGRR